MRRRVELDARAGPTRAPQTGLVKVQITIPPAASTSSSSARKPRYVSPATQSVTLFAPGGATTTVALTTSNPSCTAQAGGLVCTVELPVPVGNSTITVSTYASTDGSGTPLSTATLAVTVAQNAVNLLPVTLTASSRASS
jgi:hypothetical protein